MKNRIIEKIVKIDAPVQIVWQVFTDANASKYIGGEYITDWQVGSTIEWKGPDGNFYTYGTVMQFEPYKLLRHNLADLQDKDRLISEFTYQFDEVEGKTILTATEVLLYDMDDLQYKEACDAWGLSLQAVKLAAEKLSSNYSF